MVGKDELGTTGEGHQWVTARRDLERAMTLGEEIGSFWSSVAQVSRADMVTSRSPTA
jgi:hypothetical protein